MKTLLKLGPADHGRTLPVEDLMSARYQEGYKYEIIDGKLYVSPLPNLPENRVEEWLHGKLLLYKMKHGNIINYLTTKARVFVPDREDLTVPEPDLAAYNDFPLDLPIADVRWEDVSPFLVAEVLSADDPAKDLFRNVALYLQVPSIREYWVIDARDNPEEPTMLVRRRYRSRWQLKQLAAGETYTTRVLPGFRLKLDPRS